MQNDPAERALRLDTERRHQVVGQFGQIAMHHAEHQ
jgi:hypothetical protein